jgi:hypothetical protein
MTAPQAGAPIFQLYLRQALATRNLAHLGGKMLIQFSTPVLVSQLFATVADVVLKFKY